MRILRHSLVPALAALVVSAACAMPAASAAAEPAASQGGKVAGIYFDKKDNSITVKADGEDKPVKYTFDASDKRLADAFKSIFPASRVQLTYKQDGADRRLLTIKKQVLRASGTVTGTVVAVYNSFWVEVKPKDGVSDAYALGPGTWNNKDFAEFFKSLQPGDSVTLTFTTDFERHRIKTMRKNPAK